MDVRGFVDANARAFIEDLKQWLAIPSIHAPNESMDLELLRRGAEAPAYLWEELAAADPG